MSTAKFGGGGNKCVICDKTAYPAETVQYEKLPYHVECFRCSICNAKKAAGQMQIFEGKLICTHDFQKGGYAQKQKQVVWSGSGAGPAATPSKFGGGGNSCTVCAKTVYAAETVSFEKKIYHADCLKCTEASCGKKITASDAAEFEGRIICRKCFAEGGYRLKQTAHVKAPTGASSSAASSRFGGGGTKCNVCDKTVYPAEMIQFEKKPFHDKCFKCVNCSKLLTPAASEGKKSGDSLTVYCKKCWGELGLNRASVQLNAHVPVAVAEPEPEAAPEAEAAPTEEPVEQQPEPQEDAAPQSEEPAAE